jgi:hypothetical protein
MDMVLDQPLVFCELQPIVIDRRIVIFINYLQSFLVPLPELIPYDPLF